MNIIEVPLNKKTGFSLIELLVVIVLIAIISIIAFVNFGNQSSKARNAMRLDHSGKILKAFQLQQVEEKIPSNDCLSGSYYYTLTGTLSGTGCNVIIDGSSDSKSFLSKLKISGNFQDPANLKVINGDEFKYEFNYLLGGNQYEFVYLMEPKEDGSLVNINKSYALEYQSGSLNSINIDGNFTSVDNIITPVILKDSNGNRLFSSLYSTGLVKGKEKIDRFNKSVDFNTALKDRLSLSGSSINNPDTGNQINHVSFFSYNTPIKFNDKIGLQTKLNDDDSSYITTDGTYVYYRNVSDGGIYRINIDGTNRIKLNDDSSNYIKADGTYVFYKNGGLYRINIDGTNKIKLNDDDSNYITTDGTYVFYSNYSDGYKLYRINIDGTNKIKLNDDLSTYITTNGTYVFYSNASDGGKLYRINIDGTNRIKLNDDSCTYITTDGTYVFYRNGRDGNKLYKSEINNIIYFSENDGIYKSDDESEDGISNTNTGIYINVSATTPNGTDYTFHLANKKTEEIIIPEGGNTWLMGDIISNMGGDPINSFGFKIGDEIILYKTGEADIMTTVSQISGGLRLSRNIGKNGSGWGIKKWDPKFKEILKSKLDGNTLIDLETELGELTNSLWYKIVLIGDSNDNTKTPVINSVQFLK